MSQQIDLALVSLVAGQFVVPVIAPVIGVTFVRVSPAWTRGEKRF